MARLEYIISGNSTSLTTATKQSVAGLKSVEQAANNANAAIKREVTPINELKSAIVNLNKTKVNIVDENALKRQNRLVQELEAELKRAQNIGRVGFDATGSAIEKSASSASKFGAALGGALSPIRTLAYILPGLGLAGIFNLAFEGIGKASNALGIFNSELTLSQNNLANLNSVNKEASKQYGEQSTNLRVLYAAATDVNNATNNRLLAAKELQKEFPSLFGNLKTEAILNGDAAKAYDVATKAILDNAKAAAAAGKIKELAGKQQEIEFNKLKIIAAKTNEITSVKPTKQIGGGAGDVITPFASQSQQQQSVKAQQQTLRDLLRGELREQDAQKRVLQGQIDFLTKFAGGNNKIAKILTDDKLTKTGETSPFEALNKQLDEVLRKSNSLSAQAGLTGYALDIQKVKDKYIELNSTLDENIKKTAESKKLTGGERSVLEAKQSADRIALAKAERDELDGEFNKSVQKALEVTKEKADKSVQIEKEARDKIAAINEEAIANIGSKQETETDKIKLEWAKRLKAAQGYYDELIKLNNVVDKNDPNGFNNAIKSLKIQGQKAATTGLVGGASNSQVENKLIEPFSRAIDQGFRKFGNDFYSTLTDVETYTKGTFSSIFADLTGKLTTSLNQVFVNVVVQGLSNALKNAISSGAGGLINANGGLTGKGAAIGGAIIGGSIISASTPKTSTVGQGLGGALSGAGTGAAIGSVVPVIGTVAGAVIGGVVGLLGGIFGSASARKKEEEQRQAQLEEAKKQTAIQKAQLDAYTSAIVGRVTAAGVISSVEVGAQGQLIANVSGKDIQFVLDRNKKTR